jgi:hypothetical protein
MAREVWGWCLFVAGAALACGKSTHDDPEAAGASAGMPAGSGAKSGRGTHGERNDAGAAAMHGGRSGADDAGRGGDDSAGASGSEDVCAALSQTAASALERLVRAHQSCDEDADCTKNSSLGGCYDGTFVLGGCWVPLASSSAETVSAAARDLCHAFEDAGCVGLHPCPSAPDLVCQTGACVFVTH